MKHNPAFNQHSRKKRLVVCSKTSVVLSKIFLDLTLSQAERKWYIFYYSENVVGCTGATIDTKI